MGHPERTEHMNPKYVYFIPELGWLTFVKRKKMPRFIWFMLSTKQLSARYSHGNYFTSLHHYFGGLIVSLSAETENSPSLNGKSTIFCKLL